MCFSKSLNNSVFVIIMMLTFSNAQGKELQVKDGDKWKSLKCSNKGLVLGNSNSWKRDGRRLIDGNTALDCPEKKNGKRHPTGDICDCGGNGEKFHGEKKGNKSVKNSVDDSSGGGIYPNSGQEVCLYLDDDKVKARKTDRKCSDFRLR